MRYGPSFEAPYGQPSTTEGSPLGRRTATVSHTASNPPSGRSLPQVFLEGIGRPYPVEDRLVLGSQPLGLDGREVPL